MKKVEESTGLWIQAVEAAPLGADPQIALAIFDNSEHKGCTQPSCRVLLVGQIPNKRFRGPVEAVEAIGGADPQFALAILVEDIDDITA